ncbi:hypothetical protein CN490_22870 [Bacillus cereus]|nr:hypothetical protein CN490_22870 [Bacillus cereus]
MQYKDFATKEEELKLIRFYQNDLNSAKLLINVTHDKVVTDFSTATKVQIAFLKPDGKRVFQEVQNVNQMQGKYYVVLSTQTLIAYGNVIAQLRLTFPNNKVIETCKFVFAVDESIMSDEAMASTNEFPVIQKAIEAGEKLEGVDINGIIAAGALAAGALPKTGGTMTGSLNIANTKVIDFLTPTSKFTLGTSTSVASPDRLYLHDNKNNKTVLDYNANNGGLLTVIGETNLLKKTGDTLTGNLRLDKSPASGTSWRSISWDLDNVEAIRMGMNATNRFLLWDSVSNIIPLEYRPEDKSLRLGTGTGATVTISGETNMLRKSGDTMTGDLKIRKDGASLYLTTAAGNRESRIFYNANEASDSGLNIQSPRGNLLLRDGNNVIREVATKEKDGRADLTLTGNGENFNGMIGPIADRKGSTVMLRAGIRRRADGTGPVVTTLPVDMRPSLTVIQVVTANDGTLARVTIQVNGDVQLESATATSIIGKDVYMAITYIAAN